MPRNLSGAAATLLLLLVLLSATAPAAPVQAATVRHPAAPLPAARLEFGLASGPGDLAWMTASGVPWKYRYTYLAGGLYSNPWPAWQDPALPPGQYALDYMTSSGAHGYIPVFPYYMLLQSHRAADEATDDYNNLNTPSLMRDYYANFTLLMQKAAQYGGQVVVQVEPDLWGYLQQRSGNTSPVNVSASVASSGSPDVAAFANNVQGFGQALLHLRDLYAPNVVMAVHASMWSSGRDLATDTDATLSPAAEADKTAAFLGATGNWDAVFNDVDDHDAGWWEATQANRAHWWDRTNASLPNFARYLAWLAELRSKTGKPQVAWQVPVGNQYYLTENNTAGHYQDDVAEYFIGHPSDLFSAGLVAVLLGAGNADQTTPYDTMHDGVTNNAGVPTSDAAGACNACNTHVSQYADDDGGYLRVFVGQYYSGPPPPPPPPPAAAAGICVLDGWGGLHPTAGASIGCAGGSAYWPGWDIARAVALFADGGGGYVLDGWGGLHQFGSGRPVASGAYWPGWDIARAVALAPWATASDPEGWVLDGWGGIHAFGGAPAITAPAYWPGWDIAHGLVIGPGSTRASVWGYTLDGYGGLHPFGGAAPAAHAAYWNGWDIARAVQLAPSSTAAAPGGYVLDGFGGVHGFGSATPAPSLTGYWPNWDIARGLTLAPGSGSAGYVLDGWGGLHPFGGAPPLSVSAYWPNWDIAHAAATSGAGSAWGRRR